MVLPASREAKCETSQDSRPQESTSDSIFGSLRNKLRRISDSQRINRLEQCQVLHGLLLQCRSQQQNRSAPSSAPSVDTADEMTIENVPAGIRMLRYFQWRDAPISDHTKSLCRREEHALWACRAVAAGCGAPLVDLKTCFDRAGPEILDHDTYYEKSEAASSEHESPCTSVQRGMANCVVDGVNTLNARLRVRKEEKPAKR